MTLMDSPRTGTRTEDELVLSCAQTCRDSERAERIGRLLEDHIDWVYLIRTAHRHGMMSLLYWHLNATCSDGVPSAVLTQLRDNFHSNTGYSLLLTGELLKILNLFEAHGISAIPFKGPTLALRVYGSLALRQYTDLDILVHQHNVRTAKDLLVSEGYQPQFRLTGQQETAFLKFSSKHTFTRNDEKVYVDLHWAITPKYLSFAPDPECLCQRLEPISLNGKRILTFSTEDLLLILCMHGAKHLWEQVMWICDVAKLVGVQKGIDWDQVMRQASMLGNERMLFLGLYLASDLLGATLPDEIRKRVQTEPAVKPLANRIHARLFEDADGSTDGFERNVFYMRTMERLGDRGRLLFDIVMTPTPLDWASMPLPRSLFMFYYALRPVRLAGKYSRTIWQRLRP